MKPGFVPRLISAVAVSLCAWGVPNTPAADALTNGTATSSSAKTTKKSPAPTGETPTNFPDAETFIYRKLDPVSPRLFVVKPQGWNASDHRSAFIYFFGGGWAHGDTTKSIGWARVAARWGMVGVAPDYRTSERFGTSPAESTADARAATRWVEDHAAELGIDKNRIVVGGNSAGGHLALWTAIAKAPYGSSADESPTTEPAALVLTSAPGDTTAAAWNNDLRLIKRFGPHMEELSPLQHLDPKMPPILIFHGEADITVPHSIAVALHDKLVASGNICEFVSVPGGGHNFQSELPGWKDKTRDRIRQFLVEQGLLDAASK